MDNTPIPGTRLSVSFIPAEVLRFAAEVTDRNDAAVIHYDPERFRFGMHFSADGAGG